VTASARRRPAAVRALTVLLALQGLCGLAGGAALVAGPHGEIMHMPVSYLQGSPFSDYLIPGLLLGLVLGALPLITFVGMLRGRAWAWFASFTVGCGLIIFELVEVSIIGYNVLQPVFGTVGVLITLITLLPSVRRYFGVRPSVRGGAGLEAADEDSA
jgi:hypothetical protein